MTGGGGGEANYICKKAVSSLTLVQLSAMSIKILGFSGSK
jgi:hypothetical protein